jgi:Family of unknown function (DUF6252)
MKILSSVTHVLAFLCLTFSLFTCKQTDVLPQATQEGKNTFGCLIDGKAYVPDGGGSFSGIKPVNGGLSGIPSVPNKTGIYIRAYSRDGKELVIFINDNKVANYVLNTNTQTRPASLNSKDYASYTSTEGDEYVTSSKFTGQITVTKADTVTGIVSGSFDFTAATKTGQTVSITNGRFDVNARTQ